MTIKGLTSRRTGRRGRGERGAALLMALMLAAVITVVALTAAAISIVERRVGENIVAVNSATLNAASAIDVTLEDLETNPQWRDGKVGGPWSSDVAVGDGTADVYGFDMVDGDFTNNPFDSVLLQAAGRSSGAVRALQVQARPAPHPGLACALFSANRVVFNGDCRVAGDIRAHLNVDKADSATVIHSGTITTGLTATVAPALIDGDTVVGADNRRVALPYPFISYLWNRSTYVLLDWSPDYRSANRKSFTPTSNPYGAANPDGVYWIDGDGKYVWLKEVYVRGTLIIANANGVIIDDGCNLQPAREGWPAIIALLDDNEEFVIQITSSRYLDEAADNFDYDQDGYKTKIFNREIRGPIVTTGSFRCLSPITIKGPVIASDIWLEGDCTVEADASLADKLIAGCLSPGLKPVSGTWTHISPPPK